MKTFFCTILMMTCISVNSQVIIQIEGFGKINCPLAMEVQGGAYKEYIENLKIINGVSASNVIFQQKGLNDGNGGFDTYARVMIKTMYGDFNSIKLVPTLQETKEVNTIFKQQIYSEAEQNNATIISWNNANSTILNGYKTIKFGYKRKIGSNPIVTVETYFIQNTDRMYSISFECRNDSYNWASTFYLIKKSLTIKK